MLRQSIQARKLTKDGQILLVSGCHKEAVEKVKIQVGSLFGAVLFENCVLETRKLVNCWIQWEVFGLKSESLEPSHSRDNVRGAGAIAERVFFFLSVLFV